MTYRSLIAVVALIGTAACGGGRGTADTTAAATQTNALPAATAQTPAGTSATVPDTTRYQHHSVLAGAAAGAAAGHMLHHHAILGAAAGALIQHERNKHAARP